MNQRGPGNAGKSSSRQLSSCKTLSMTMTNSKLTPPAHSDQLILDVREDEHILVLTMNRPKTLNAMTPTMADDIKHVLDWFDEEPSLWVVILAGAGRLWCAGADLKAWNDDIKRGITNEQERIASNINGFGSVSRRSTSCKPIIAAVEGGAYGGGVEMILNCDIVVASDDAKFALPEAKRGVVAGQGVIPRLNRVAGHQFAAEMLFLGNVVSAVEAQSKYRFVNRVVPRAEVLGTSLWFARQIVANSPESVQSHKRGLVASEQIGSYEEALRLHVWSPEAKRAYNGQNIKEGLQAFNEKRAPRWTNPAKL